LALARRGERGYAEMIEGQAEIGDYLEQRLEEAGWVHVSRSPLPVCCVTHPRAESGETSLDAVLKLVLKGGRAWISKVTLGDRVALRACITSSLTTRHDIDVLVADMNAAVGA
jgi:glutamate/tyrosine decarboxylase-like PLP-dependent enzyme